MKFDFPFISNISIEESYHQYKQIVTGGSARTSVSLHSYTVQMQWRTLATFPFGCSYIYSIRCQSGYVPCKFSGSYWRRKFASMGLGFCSQLWNVPAWGKWSKGTVLSFMVKILCIDCTYMVKKGSLLQLTKLSIVSLNARTKLLNKFRSCQWESSLPVSLYMWLGYSYWCERKFISACGQWSELT